MNTVFDNNIELLEILFSKEIITNKLTRLKNIYDRTELVWYKNLDRLKDIEIKYILLAEAPPWSEDGIPRYFYEKIESKYHRKIWKTFFPNTEIPNNSEIAYQKLADSSFLLIDTIPFSMKYSSTKRKKLQYQNIIKNSLYWWQDKINNEKIILSKDVKIAFAFKLNAVAIINSTNGSIKLKNEQTICLNENLISADLSGYTNSEKLRNIYNIKFNVQ